MSREQKLMKGVEAEASALCQKILKTMGPQQQIVAMNALYLAMQVVDSAGVKNTEPSNGQVERPHQRQPLTERERELLRGLIERELRHAAQCDDIPNRTMAERQKCWDLERVTLLRRLAAT